MINIEKIIKKIRELVKSQWYIYALCMILFEDFHVVVEELHNIDYRLRISEKEASLLLGFLIQNDIDLTYPNQPTDLIEMIDKTYTLLEKLHSCLLSPYMECLTDIESNPLEVKEDFEKFRNETFSKWAMIIEPIFYSGTWAYDIQYINFLDKKYKYDKKWLIENRYFDFDISKKILYKIKNIIEEKSKKVHLFDFTNNFESFIEKLRKENPTEDFSNKEKIYYDIKFDQYRDLFINGHEKNCEPPESLLEDNWQEFYNNLLDLFLIKKSFFEDEKQNFENFINNFSIIPNTDTNKQFNCIWDYNLINSHPIIKISEDNYFVPIVFLLFESIYESPFYWMLEDKEYFSKFVSKHRWEVWEEMAYEFLSEIFWKENTIKSVKIITNKWKDDTDIDVLCVLWSKALCVQVKSKKLTELSKKGNDENLREDFKLAVQEAYNQWLISRWKILKNDCKFFDKNWNQIILKDIDDVYIMCLTTENYPTLTHQTDIMLEKKQENPFPIALTIFDLQLLTHYLKDPYDFLYYIRQRISLMGYFKAEEEIIFLWYHLDQKLWKFPDRDMVALDNNFWALIDRNYYPFMYWLSVSDENDAIKHKWRNEKFDELCYEIKLLDTPKSTDIIFHLLDLSWDTRDNLIKYILETKHKTLVDAKPHNFSIPTDSTYEEKIGITYVSYNSNEIQKLSDRLEFQYKLRKYKSKADLWISFWSLRDSKKIVDIVRFDETPWEHNEEMERLTQDILKTNGWWTHIRLWKKVGRNDVCPCWSWKKYKHCCWKIIT